MYKKLLALTMIASIVLMFSIVPAIATENPPNESTEPPTAPTAWTSTSSAAGRTLQTITASYIRDSAVTVTAYQIVKGTYKDDKFTGYVKCAGLASVPDIDNFDYVSPSSDCITKIANYIEGHPTAFDSVQMTGSGSTYTATVEAGEYIILVRKASNNTESLQTVYNPAVVAVNVSDANLGSDPPSSTGGTVYMTSQFSFGPTAYIKSSEASNMNKYGSGTASFGDKVDFVIVGMRIPSYSEDYGPAEDFTVKYIITDNLNPDDLPNSPFLGVNGLTVKVGPNSGNGYVADGNEVAEGANTYTINYYDQNGSKITNKTAENLTQAVKYEIEFADAFIRANGTKYVNVDYSSTFTDNAKLALQDYSGNFVSNDTRATVCYSNDPTNEDSYYEFSNLKTSTYTFGIDAVGNGIQTYELNKVTQALGANDSYKSNTTNGISTMKSDYPLAGATFTIYSDRAMTQDQDHIIGTATSDANGHIEFRGLAPGTYYIKETAAPSEYTLNENNYKIVISKIETYRLEGYSITTYLMGENDTQIGLAEYTISGNSITPAEIVNTRLATLPSTGGMGTIVISVVAGLGMVVFLTIFVISKKKKAKKINTQTID